MIDIENTLPYRQGFKKSHKYSWGHRFRFSNHPTNNISPYKLVRRILSNNLGKSFAMAFHYYCSKIPQYQQHIFLQEFEECQRSSYWDYYYIDEQGNIQQQINRRRNKDPYKVYSDDYKVTYKIKNKYTGFREEEVKEIPWYANKEEYTPVYHGLVWEFESKKDPIYVAYKRKKYQQQKKFDRDLKKQRAAEFDYKLELTIRKQQEKKKKELELDILKRNAAGFDEESFKGSAYHGRKGKLKK